MEIQRKLLAVLCFFFDIEAGWVWVGKGILFHRTESTHKYILKGGWGEGRNEVKEDT